MTYDQWKLATPPEHEGPDEDEEYCPCGGPPCQTPAGHGCGLSTKREWIEHWDREGQDVAVPTPDFEQ